MINRLPIIVSALIVAAGLVSGCAEVRDAAGLAKKSPDEFQVMARPPLSLPPNFTLTPPTPGAPPPQSGSADQQAKAKILGRAPQNTATKPAPADLSAGESALYSALAGVTVEWRSFATPDERAVDEVDELFAPNVGQGRQIRLLSEDRARRNISDQQTRKKTF